jgi:hypothetical protein
MDQILVDIALLRAMALPDVKLTPGRVIVARVVGTAADGRGELSIAGARLGALLPAGVHEGDELRLLVKEVSADRVLLVIQPDAAAENVLAAPIEPRAEGEIDPDAGEGSVGATATHVLALRYDAPSLGMVDLRFEMYEGALRVVVAMAAGAPVAAARAASEELHDALARASSLQVSVAVTERRLPLDMYV